MFLSMFTRNFGRTYYERNEIQFFYCRSVANDRYSIWKLGITHVLNAAHGRQHCLGSHAFYGSTVDYHGVPADDSPSFDISPYFYSSANYIQDALNTADGR